MISRVIRALHGPLPLAGLALTLAGLSQPASARVWVGFGFPLYFGPPVYYPPPVYYSPPPPYYQPPPYYPPPAYSYAPPGPYNRYAQSCVVTGTVCPMERPVTPGSSCYCTTAQGRMWGRAT
jgi:hypothetical protein